MPDNLFDGDDQLPEGNEVEVRFEDLVGEGKKYKDHDAAAKAIAEKDRFIEQLKTENAAFRQTASQALKMEEFLDRLNSAPRTTTPVENEPPVQDKTGLTQKEAEELIQRQLTQHETQTLMQRNLEAVREELVKKFGSNYKAKLKNLTEELGVGEQFMNTLAAQQPKAFMKMIAPVSGTPENISPPSGSGVFAPDVKNPQGVRRRSFYNELRKKDPKAYQTVKVQQQMYKDIQAQGEAFLD